MPSSAPSPSRGRPDVGEQLAKLALLILMAGLLWGTVVGAVQIAAALIRWVSGE